MSVKRVVYVMKHKDKRGFILIELLAVIIILAIILLISVPSVTNMILILHIL